MQDTLRKDGREKGRNALPGFPHSSLSRKHVIHSNWEEYIQTEFDQETTFKVRTGLVLPTTRNHYPLCAGRVKGWEWFLEFRPRDPEKSQGEESYGAHSLGPAGKTWRNKHPASFSTCLLISWVLPMVELVWELKGKDVHWCNNPHRSATQGTERDAEGWRTDPGR